MLSTLAKTALLKHVPTLLRTMAQRNESAKQAEQSEESVRALALPATAPRSASASFACILSSTGVSVVLRLSTVLLFSMLSPGVRSSPTPTAPFWLTSSFMTTKSVTVNTMRTPEHVGAAWVDRPRPLRQ